MEQQRKEAERAIEAITGSDVAQIDEYIERHGVNWPLTEQGSTALMVASAHGADIAVRHITSKYPESVSCSNKNGATALIFAIHGGHREAVRALLQNGSDINHVLNSGDSALNVAAGVGDIEIVQLLLDVNGVSLNSVNEDGQTALHTACCEGHESVVQALVAAGAECDTIDCNGVSPLLDACRCGHVSIAKQLLEKGADMSLVSDRVICSAYSDDDTRPATKQKIVNMLRSREWLPIYDIKRCCETNDAEAFMALVRGQHLSPKELATPLAGGGATALMLSCLHGSKEMVRYLLDTRLASVKERTANGREPLSYAAWNGHVDIIRFLVQHGATVDAVSASGDAPVTYACINGHSQAVDALLELGASREYLALNVQHESVLDVLRKHGVR